MELRVSGPKVVILVGALIGACMCLYPPYRCQGTSPREVVPLPGGRHFILSPPKDDRYNTGRSEYVVSCRIDKSLFYGQLLLLTIATVTVATILYAVKRGRDDV